MSVHGSENGPYEPRLPPESLTQPQQKKGTLDVQGSLREVIRIASMPSADQRKELPKAAKLVRTLYYAVKENENLIKNSDLHLLENFHKTVSKDSRLFNSLRTLHKAFKVKDSTQCTITTAQLEKMSPSEFWQHISELLEKNPSLLEVTIEGQGSFSREELATLITLDTKRPPETLGDLIHKLRDRFSWKHVNKKYTPLHLHVVAGRSDLIATDLQSIPVDEPDKRGYSALQWACYLGEKEIASQLIQAKADCNFGDNPPLFHAIESGNADIVRLLLQNGADISRENNLGDSVLEFAMKFRTPEVVKLLLQHGADIPDENGNTLLLRYVHIGKIEFLLQISKFQQVEFLLQNGVDVNFRDKMGNTGLINAAMHENIQLVELLLQYGADITIPNKDGNTVLTLLKIINPAHAKKIKQLIEYYTCKEIFNKAIGYSQLYKGTKLLSHSYALAGTSFIQGQELHLEGTFARLSAKTVAKSIQGFAMSFPALLHKSSARHIAQSFIFASDKISHTPQQVLQRIRRGQPTCILTGFKEHSVTVLIWKNLFIHCNRGGASEGPLFIYRFDPQKLGEEEISLLMKSKLEDDKSYMETLRETIPTRLGFHQSENEVELQKLAALPMQLIGNCSWASVEGMLKAYLLLDRLQKSSFVLPQDTAERAAIKEALDTTFTSWLLFQRLELLDKYLDNPVDHRLISMCFSSLRSANTTEPELIARIKALENKYYLITSASEYRSYVINKLLFSIFPSQLGWHHLQGYLDLNSYLSAV